MTRPEDKAIERIMHLPKPIRQAVLDFLTVSASASQSPEALAEELSDSICLKFALATAQRN